MSGLFSLGLLGMAGMEVGSYCHNTYQTHGCAWMLIFYGWVFQILIFLLRCPLFGGKAQLRRFKVWGSVFLWLGWLDVCLGPYLGSSVWIQPLGPLRAVLCSLPALVRFAFVILKYTKYLNLSSIIQITTMINYKIIAAFKLWTWLTCIINESWSPYFYLNFLIIYQCNLFTYNWNVEHSMYLIKFRYFHTVNYYALALLWLNSDQFLDLSFTDKGKQKIFEQLFSEVVITASEEVKNSSPDGDVSEPRESRKTNKPKNKKQTKKFSKIKSKGEVGNSSSSLSTNL